MILKIISLLTLLLLLLVLVIAGPLATIWSLNTLFALGIEYQVKTWLAVVWLSMVTFGGLKTAIKHTNKRGNL